MLGTSFLRARCTEYQIRIQLYPRCTSTYETLPRILIQEAHRDIEGRATPALKSKCIRESVACLLGNVNHVDGTKTSREQALVGITPGGVHDERSGILANGLGERLGALLDDDVAPSELARRGGVERSTLGVGPVGELGDLNFGLETGLSLQFCVKIRFGGYQKRNVPSVP